MKTKSLLIAAATLVSGVLLMPSDAQAGGRRDYGYTTYRSGCYAPVIVRPVKVVRPVRVVRAPVVCLPAPAIRVSFGFGGRCY